MVLTGKICFYTFYYDSLSEPRQLHGVWVDTQLLWYAVAGRDADHKVSYCSASVNAAESESELYNACLPERTAHRLVQLWSAADMELRLSYGRYELPDARFEAKFLRHNKVRMPWLYYFCNNVCWRISVTRETLVSDDIVENSVNFVTGCGKWLSVISWESYFWKYFRWIIIKKRKMISYLLHAECLQMKMLNQCEAEEPIELH